MIKAEVTRNFKGNAYLPGSPIILHRPLRRTRVLPEPMATMLCIT